MAAKRAGPNPDGIHAGDDRPLAGARILVTRTREQAGELARALRDLGAEVVEAPAIRIEPPRTWAQVDRALQRAAAGEYAWIVLTSANGVRILFERLASLGLRPSGAKIAAVGPGTAGALASLGAEPDLVPSSFTTEAVGQAFPTGTARVLLARADVVEPGLDEALHKKGWMCDRIVLYHLRKEDRLDPGVRRAVLEGGIDVLTFASGGTVRAFLRLLGGRPFTTTRVACIGPVTARAAQDAGLRVDAIAAEHTIAGLARAAAEAWHASRR